MSTSMEFHLLPIFALLSLTVVASHAAISPQAYWNSVLPNTPMPKAVKNLLPQEGNVGVSRGSISLSRGGKDLSGHNYFGGKDLAGHNYFAGTVGVSRGSISVSRGDKDLAGHNYFAEASVGISEGGKSVGRGDKDLAGHNYFAEASVGVSKGGKSVGKGDKDLAGHNYFAGEDQQLQYIPPNETVFFLEKGLKQGTNMNLDLSEDANGVKFLPRLVAQSIPFSSNQFPKILNRFSIKPNSAEAEIMKKTIKDCKEKPGFEGEQRYCATSLEGMIDFCTSKLGKNVEALSTELEKETPVRKYSVAGFKKIGGGGGRGGGGGGGEVVVCHLQKYPYAVFYCHNVHSTKAYMVSLEGAAEEQKKIKAKGVAVCHTDTAAWNPKHLAFQMLKVKPGTVPICHILPEDNIIWLAN